MRLIEPKAQITGNIEGVLIWIFRSFINHENLGLYSRWTFGTTASLCGNLYGIGSGAILHGGLRRRLCPGE